MAYLTRGSSLEDVKNNSHTKWLTFPFNKCQSWFKWLVVIWKNIYFHKPSWRWQKPPECWVCLQVWYSDSEDNMKKKSSICGKWQEKCRMHIVWFDDKEVWHQEIMKDDTIAVLIACKPFFCQTREKNKFMQFFCYNIVLV